MNFAILALSLHGRDKNESVIPDPARHNYSCLRPLTDSKLKHLKQMYRDLIPTDRCLSFLQED